MSCEHMLTNGRGEGYNALIFWIKNEAKKLNLFNSAC